MSWNIFSETSNTVGNKMNKVFFFFTILIILQFCNLSPASAQASIYLQKKGGFMISVDDTPASDADVANWELYRVLFNKYGYKFNIALQSEGLNRPVVSAEVKKMMADGHEMMDHCPQENVSEFKFQNLEDDAKYYNGKTGYDFYNGQSGVFSVTKTGDKIGDQVDVILKTGSTLDPTALPVLAERTRLLYRRYLKDSIHYPKLLAQPGGSLCISHIDGYKYLTQVGYTGCAYDGNGNGPDEVVTKTYNVPKDRYGNFNIKRSDWGADFTNIKNLIANSMAKHIVFSILFHFQNIPDLLSSTEDLLKWTQANNVPLLPISQWMTNLFMNTPDPTINVFPDITKDLDGDGIGDGYEAFYKNESTLVKDPSAPGGNYIVRKQIGSFFELRGLGGIEKGGNIVSFSAKGDLGAEIQVQMTCNGQRTDKSIILDSTDWKEYQIPFDIPQTSILSDITILLKNTKSQTYSIAISNWQLYKFVKKPTINILSDQTITIKEKLTLSAEPGCTNYLWSTGDTTQNIVFDGSKSGPGTFPISYTADDAIGALIADKAKITVKGIKTTTTSLTLAAKNGTGTFDITANIPWTITSTNGLIKANVTSGQSSATITISMADNTSIDPVADVINIKTEQGTISIPVTQSGVAPIISVDKTPLTSLAAGEQDQVELTSNTKWSIIKLPTWLNCLPLTGKGNTALSVTIAPNLMAIPRKDTIIYKALNGPLLFLIVNQSAADPLLTINKNSILAKALAKTDTINVVSNAAWTITGLPTWITADKTSGTGGSEIHLNIAPNSSITDRVSTFKIGVLNGPSQSVTVQQAGADYVTVDKSTITSPAAGKTDIIHVTSNVDWTVSTKATWITFTPNNGTKKDSIHLTTSANLKAEDRQDTLFIKGTNLTAIAVVVKQTAAIPTIVITPTSITSTYTGDTIPLQITSNGSWTATDLPNWASLKATKGTGNLIDTLVILPFKLLTDRTGKITFTLKNNTTLAVNMTQTAAPLYIIPLPTSINLGPKAGDSTTLKISSNTSWKIISIPYEVKSNLGSYITFVGDTVINLKLMADGSIGEDQLRNFTIQDASNKISLNIPITIKMFPGVLSVPVDTIKFSSAINDSKTIKIQSNIGWNVSTTSSVNWLSISPTFSAQGNADLTLKCSASNGSTKDREVGVLIQQAKGTVSKSILIIQSGSNVGIEDYEKSGFKIYPQPAHDILNIDLPANHKLINWEIYGTSGVSLLNGRISSGDKLQIPISNFKPGLYFISFLSETKKTGFKFTVN
jgi:hypothetical protein